MSFAHETSHVLVVTCHVLVKEGVIVADNQPVACCTYHLARCQCSQITRSLFQIEEKLPKSAERNVHFMDILS